MSQEPQFGVNDQKKEDIQNNQFLENMDDYKKLESSPTHQNQLVEDHKSQEKNQKIVQGLSIFLQDILSKLKQDTTIEVKITAFKGILERIHQSKNCQEIVEPLCSWLINNKIKQKYLHDDSHAQILKKMPLILKFLYEKNMFNSKQIVSLTLSGLSCHDQYLRVVQSAIHFLKIEDLRIVFQSLTQQKGEQNANLPQLLLAIINNKQFFEECSQKPIINKNKHFSILSELQNDDKQPLLDQQQNRKQEIQPNYPKQQQIHKEIVHLSLQLFQFLTHQLQQKLHLNIGNLIKLISSKYKILSQILVNTLAQLFKSGKPSYLWILEHCLKMDLRAGGKQKGSKNALKINLIQKLANEGAYEYTIACLARNRFNKQITDKALNVLILFSKNYKPLEKIYTQYIWKALGLNSRDEKEREQFFSFVRESLRNESSFTQESVDYIYFQILMKMNSKWFSIRIVECLELLFMRLNEDLKQISYNNNTYSICNPDLIGLQKFWYIYFYTHDSKVQKKCKQFLWKLSTYSSEHDIKIQLYQKYLNRIIRCMVQSTPQQKEKLTVRGFEVIDKMLQQGQKKETTSQYLQLNIRNETTQAVPPKNISLTISEKSCLSHLKQQISEAINPSVTNLDLLLRGLFLKGEKMTLKELSIQNGQTILVTNQSLDEETVKRAKQLVKQNQTQLIEIFGSEIEAKLLSFIAQKMEGENLEKIMNSIMDQFKMQVFREQFQSKMLNQEEENKKIFQGETNNIKQHYVYKNMEAQMQDEYGEKQQNQLPLNFSSMLTRQPQSVLMLLSCAQQSNYINGWETVKKIPLTDAALLNISKLAQNMQWELIFPRSQQCQMQCIYNAHILNKLLKDQSRIDYYMQQRKGMFYLVEWLDKLLESNNHTLLQYITQLMVKSLYKYKQLEIFQKRCQNSVYNQNLLNQLIEISYMESTDQFQSQVSSRFSSQNLGKIVSLLVDMERKNHNSSFPYFNLASLLMFTFQFQQKGSILFINLNESEMYRVLQLHGYMAQFLILYSASKLITKNQNKKDQLLEQLLLKNMDNLFKIQPKSSELSVNFKALYDTIACILKYRCSSDYTPQISIVTRGIEIIQHHSSQMTTSQFSGILQIINICLQSLYFSQIIQNTELGDKASQFVQWIFSTFLFQLNNPHCLIKQKQIRKNCYKIISLTINYSHQLLSLICQLVVNIGIQYRHKDQDYLDFRKTDFLGLTNLGATCYINSLLQQVYHTKFSKLLLEQNYQMMEQNLESIKMKELKKVFIRLFSSIKNVVNPKQFIKSINFYGEPINTSVQQDATQFLLCLFDYIQSEGYSKQVQEVFGGSLCNEITAYDEQNLFIKNNIEHFNSIGIDIKGKKNLQQALAYFIKPQNLDGDNMYYCQQLGKKTKATKRAFIQKMPNILLITLKRFQFDYESQSRCKLNDYFEFPLELDMHKYSAPHLRDKQQSSDSKYNLTGILVHSGSADAGHYYSFIKVGQKWFQFNDKHVSEFNITNNIRNQCFGCAEGKKTHNAYMLFYQKNDSNYHGIQLGEISDDNKMKQQILQQNSIFLKNRLVYDENFMKFVDQLYEKSLDERIDSIRSVVSGKKPDSSPIVHFDLDDQSKPLLNDQFQGDFDQANFADPAGFVDDFTEFDPPSAY